MSEVNRPKMKLWLKLLLAGSLALNLAIVGLAAGATMRHKGGDNMGASKGGPPSIGAMLFRDLDRDARDALRNKAEGGHESYRAKRRAENDEFIALLRDEPFDASALEAVLEGQAQKREDFQSAVRRAWLLQLTEMSHDDREDYADRVERRMRQGRGGSRK